MNRVPFLKRLMSAAKATLPNNTSEALICKKKWKKKEGGGGKLRFVLGRVHPSFYFITNQILISKVNLMRKYRIGELPDIQISYSDVIRPLRNLCYFDEQFSRILTVELITSLASTASVENLRVLRSSLVRIINNFDLADRMLVATVLEALTPIMDLQESLSPDEASTSKKLSFMTERQAQTLSKRCS